MFLLTFRFVRVALFSLNVAKQKHVNEIKLSTVGVFVHTNTMLPWCLHTLKSVTLSCVCTTAY